MTSIATSSIVTLVSLSLNDDLSLSFVMSAWIVGAILVFILYFLIRKYSGLGRGQNFEIDKAEVGLGQGKIIFKPNIGDQQIAYQIWIELSTRKIGLPIDLQHDVVVEVYKSWYEFFSITRELVKDIPVNKVKNKSTQEIINLSISLLNDGLRPHLTLWQARFRHWYELQSKKVKAEDDIDPQTLQAKYPRFKELKKDMEIVNERLIKYREKMYELVLGPLKETSSKK
ncbi:hypothetical protein KAR26_00170 [Candidatus Parcubacteria bacterium]|nr:hypothetical protein [Candidatus Parcubacteria bacterium]